MSRTKNDFYLLLLSLEDNNTRVLFERVLTSMSVEKARYAICSDVFVGMATSCWCRIYSYLSKSSRISPDR